MVFKQEAQASVMPYLTFLNTNFKSRLKSLAPLRRFTPTFNVGKQGIKKEER
jgi:hypothetical protein